MNIKDVMTINEAAERWGIVEGTIRYAIRTHKLIKDVDYRKTGRITLVTKKAMVKLYGAIEEGR